jgi:hypothetical protein
MGFVVAQRGQRQPLAIEQLADIQRQIEHECIDIGGRVNPVGERLQLLEEFQTVANAVRAAAFGRTRMHHASLSAWEKGYVAAIFLRRLLHEP